MISCDNKLIYGYKIDKVSSKFINVQKIIFPDYYRLYILDNGYVYFNECIDTDNFVKINCTSNTGTGTKFVDIGTNPTTCNSIFAIGIDGKLYVVNDGVLGIVTNIDYDHNLHITNIYTSSDFIIIKTSNYEYYKMNNDYKLEILGQCDRIHYTLHGIIAISNNDVQITGANNNNNSLLLTIINDNIDILYKIPEGSFLRYGNYLTNSVIQVTKYPVKTDDKIIIYEENRSIGILDNSVFKYLAGMDNNMAAYIQQHLQGCLFNKNSNSNRFTGIKKADKNS